MALTQDTMIDLKGMITYQDYPVAAGAVIHHQAVVGTSEATGGYLVPVADAAGMRPVGIATLAVDNRGGADGDAWCRVYKGAARLPTTGPNALTQADVGGRAFVLDDELVVRADGTQERVEAGAVLEVEPGFAWVMFA
jgi:hypothetical protein